MLDHITLHVSDFTKAKEFYTKALLPLDYAMTSDFPEWSVAGYGVNGKPDLWLHADEFKQAGHIAIAAQSKEAVDLFYKAALEAGAKDNGAPGYRKQYAPGYYAAFVIDLDGHNLEAVYHDPNPTA